jgi:radical SAM superfamily enzyme YgiQ (UPF0313 family)
MSDQSERACRVLIVNPKFNGESFWAYRATCELVGARYPAPSLGLITVAAMLPADWDVRLIDRNVDPDEVRFQAELDWADLVMSGGMLPQQLDHFAVIARARAAGRPIAVGGPDVSSSPHLYREANFRIIGEAEGCIGDFLAAWERGDLEGEFQAPLYSVDVTKSPIPRFDLLDFRNYVEITVQFSRGCPFRCEFCDIIELYGRNPRTKTSAQVLAELERLYELGYRGVLEFSDDNLIGNKKAVKAFLPDLIAWQKAHGFPFEFATEASLNLADDEPLLGLLRDANFFAVGIGIESPDPDVLVAMQKKQNTRRDIVDNIHKIQSYGIFVLSGFIIGFDNEGDRVAAGMIELIEAACIPICMVGLLYALPNTQLTRRLQKEGRLHALHDAALPDETDQCTAGLNFETVRPRRDVLDDYRRVLERVYDAGTYFARITRTIDHLDCSGVNGVLHAPRLGRSLRDLARFLWSVSRTRPDMRGRVWRLIAHVAVHNPRAVRAAMYMAAIYAHLGPYSRSLIDQLERQLAEAPALPVTSEALRPMVAYGVA